MSKVSVVGRCVDETARLYYEVWLACLKAEVPAPREVETYFDGSDPSPNGLQVDLDSSVVKKVESGYVIDLTKLREYHPDVSALEVIIKK